MGTPGMFSASGRSSGPRLVHSSDNDQGPSVVSRLAPVTAEPFADDAAGAGYFSTDYHHRFLVTAIRERLAKARGFVLVSGEPSADGEMLARYLTDEKETGYRVALVRCRTGMVAGVDRSASSSVASSSPPSWATSRCTTWRADTCPSPTAV